MSEKYGPHNPHPLFRQLLADGSLSLGHVVTAYTETALNRACSIGHVEELADYADWQCGR
jgi:hypothetical protein